MPKIIVEFESMDEFEAFRTSGKKTRGKAQVDDTPTVEEVTAAVAANTPPAQPQFTPPAQQTAAPQGFPGAGLNSGSAPAAATTHPLVTAIIARIDGALQSGQSTDAIVGWFRQQIGPEAVNATLEQIKQIFVPRMSEAQLKSLAPMLGIQG